MKYQIFSLLFDFIFGEGKGHKILLFNFIFEYLQSKRSSEFSRKLRLVLQHGVNLVTRVFLSKVLSCPLHACISRRPIMVMQDLSKHFIVDFIYFVKSNMTLFGKTNGRFVEGCVIDFSWPKICLLPALKNKVVIRYNEIFFP